MLTTKKIKTFTLTVGLLVGLFGCSLASAQIKISVSPQKFDMTVLPGSSQTGQIRLRNDSSRPLQIRAEVTPFNAQDESGQMSFEDNPELADWISFEEDVFILRPGEDKRVPFKVDIPGDVNPGGYYLFAYFQTNTPALKEDTGPRVVPAVGVPFLISTTEMSLSSGEVKENDPEVVDFSISDEFRSPFLEKQLARFVAFASDQTGFHITKSMPGKFLVTVKNNGLYHIRPEGVLHIYKEEAELATGKLKGETILPGKSRTFEVEVDGDLNKFAAVGNYKAELDLKSGSVLTGEVSTEKVSLSFFNLPYYFWVLVGLLIGIILLRKRFLLILKSSFGFSGA